MKDLTKYCGVIPAFYACYDAEGNISTEGAKALTRHLIAKGVKGVYVGGSSGECIYQHPDERKKLLEAVMSEAKGKITVIAHVGCNNTADSVELAAHAESVGVDAICFPSRPSTSTCLSMPLPSIGMTCPLPPPTRISSSITSPQLAGSRPDHEPAA